MIDLRDADETLIDRIYEAAVLPEFWSQVLGDFATAAECREGVLMSIQGESSKLITSSPSMEQLTRQILAYPGAEERTSRLLATRRAGFVSDDDVFTPEEIAAKPFFSDFLAPRGYGWGVATVINLPDRSTIVLHAEGDIARPRERSAVVARLDAFRPHFARSALISARLQFERARTAVETLSGLGLAACAVTGAGTVLLANDLFASEKRFWTTRGGDRIALIDRRADAQLREALAALGSGHGPVRSLALVAVRGPAPAVLHVVPIRRAAHDLFGHAAAILVLTRPSEAPIMQTPLLQALFDLTPTEASLAARIAAGRTAEEIAHADAKTVGTVRNQLKSVLAKCGCRRQVDLARLLAQLVPGGGAPTGS